jgi:hypothetical protein
VGVTGTGSDNATVGVAVRAEDTERDTDGCGEKVTDDLALRAPPPGVEGGMEMARLCPVANEERLLLPLLRVRAAAEGGAGDGGATGEAAESLFPVAVGCTAL